jgi:hypothetical protein
MINEAAKLIENYHKWLKEKTVLSQVNDCVEITTPYIDRHNDYIQIYLKKDGSNFILTDDGYTIDDLLMSGVKLDSPKREELLKITLNAFGITRDGNALTLRTNSSDFSLKKHNLVQSILAVNDMFYAASAHVANLFFEDVKEWLNIKEIRYTENVIFKGKTSFDRKFDFVVPKSSKEPERLIKIASDLNKNIINSLIMDWLDTKDVRPDGSSFYVFANDREKSLRNDSMEALKHYEILAVSWSEREKYVAKLAA